MKTVFLLVGCPASGKSTIAEALSDRFRHVAHDDYQGDLGAYVEALVTAAGEPGPAVLGETPFSLSKIQEPLEEAGVSVVPVFILEDETELHRRWDERGNVGPSTRRGHLTRQRTYAERAEAMGAFAGSPDEVLWHLKTLAG